MDTTVFLHTTQTNDLFTKGPFHTIHSEAVVFDLISIPINGFLLYNNWIFSRSPSRGGPPSFRPFTDTNLNSFVQWEDGE